MNSVRSFLFSTTCFGHTYWPLQHRKIQVRQGKCYRRV